LYRYTTVGDLLDSKTINKIGTPSGVKGVKKVTAAEAGRYKLNAVDP
jgi:hypothetical protein